LCTEKTGEVKERYGFPRFPLRSTGVYVHEVEALVLPAEQQRRAKALEGMKADLSSIHHKIGC
jgi:hypothetical protein